MGILNSLRNFIFGRRGEDEELGLPTEEMPQAPQKDYFPWRREGPPPPPPFKDREKAKRGEREEWRRQRVAAVEEYRKMREQAYRMAKESERLQRQIESGKISRSLAAHKKWELEKLGKEAKALKKETAAIRRKWSF